MFSAKKRIKLSNTLNNKNENESPAANSIDQGIESDFSSRADLTGSGDFSLPAVKRKIPFFRRSSFINKQRSSFESADQTSSGYGSLLHTSISFSPKRKSQNQTPKKRKLEETERDENAFYNSYQFVSPLKARKEATGIKRAKLILKEKSSSENVILSSTPIRTNNKNKLWGKFRSLHPEKFNSGSFDDPEPFEKLPPLPSSTNASFECGSSFDFTESFDLSEHHDKDKISNIPSSLEQLCTGSILGTIPEDKIVEENVTQTSITSNISSTSRTRFHIGRERMNILGRLHMENNIATKLILGYLNDVDLLSLSHVSKDYQKMIKSDKMLEIRRKNYLTAHQRHKENLQSGSLSTSLPKTKTLKTQKRAIFNPNFNHSMQLRSKTPSPPVSPSSKKFHENQKVAQTHSGEIKKCPRCKKPARVNQLRIRSSPRKKKLRDICSISSTTSAGRVHKRKTFLAKPSIDASLSEHLYVSFPMLENRSGSASPSSPSMPSSDESYASSGEMEASTEIYEYAVCSGISCCFKFCVKCDCKYHPRQKCKDLSPVSPQRSYLSKSSVACSQKSKKSLKRLFN